MVLFMHEARHGVCFIDGMTNRSNNKLKQFTAPIILIASIALSSQRALCQSLFDQALERNTAIEMSHSCDPNFPSVGAFAMALISPQGWDSYGYNSLTATVAFLAERIQDPSGENLYREETNSLTPAEMEMLSTAPSEEFTSFLFRKKLEHFSPQKAMGLSAGDFSDFEEYLVKVAKIATALKASLTYRIFKENDQTVIERVIRFPGNRTETKREGEGKTFAEALSKMIKPIGTRARSHYHLARGISQPDFDDEIKEIIGLAGFRLLVDENMSTIVRFLIGRQAPSLVAAAAHAGTAFIADHAAKSLPANVLLPPRVSSPARDSSSASSGPSAASHVANQAL